MNTQKKKNADIIINKGADYLLCVKDNHPKLHRTIQNFVDDDILRSYMDTMSISEKNRDRYETRTAYTMPFIDWLDADVRHEEY